MQSGGLSVIISITRHLLKYIDYLFRVEESQGEEAQGKSTFKKCVCCGKKCEFAFYSKVEDSDMSDVESDTLVFRPQYLLSKRKGKLFMKS